MFHLLTQSKDFLWISILLWRTRPVKHALDHNNSPTCSRSTDLLSATFYEGQFCTLCQNHLPFCLSVLLVIDRQCHLRFRGPVSCQTRAGRQFGNQALRTHADRSDNGIRRDVGSRAFVGEQAIGMPGCKKETGDLIRSRLSKLYIRIMGTIQNVQDYLTTSSVPTMPACKCPGIPHTIWYVLG